MRKNRMPSFFIVVGDSQSGKSRTIRALTGAFQRGLWQVATQDGNMDIFVQIRALQEANIGPEEFVQTINETENVLVALRLRALRNNPDAFEYIESFNENIAAIVLLGPAPPETLNGLNDMHHDFLLSQTLQSVRLIG